jgi:hypothetical protein
MTAKPAKYYARLICDHLKQLSNQFADDPETVRIALGLTESEFQLGLDWCVERKIIDLEPPSAAAPLSGTQPLPALDDTQDGEPVAEPALAGV